ncbi:hypothetical protein, partial [Bacillus inaquosorum]|uniref:hypothetical protein n=1 Tax=Bacillus inaquosorum TaxID=483913 RepID=UPI002281FCA6
PLSANDVPTRVPRDTPSLYTSYSLMPPLKVTASQLRDTDVSLGVAVNPWGALGRSYDGRDTESRFKFDFVIEPSSQNE